MSEEKEKPAYMALLRDEKEHTVEIETVFGKCSFSFKVLPWFTLEKLKSDCMSYDPLRKQVVYDEATMKKNKLLRAITKHPFPEGQYEALMMSLDPGIARKLLDEIEAKENEAIQTSKN